MNHQALAQPVLCLGGIWQILIVGGRGVRSLAAALQINCRLDNQNGHLGGLVGILRGSGGRDNRSSVYRATSCIRTPYVHKNLFLKNQHRIRPLIFLDFKKGTERIVLSWF